MWFALICALAISPPASDSGLARSLLNGASDPIRFDYGSLRFEAEDESAGWQRMAALQREVSRLSAPNDVVEGDRFDPTQGGCALPAVIGGLELARRAPDAATYQAARHRSIALFDEAAAELRERLSTVTGQIEKAVVRDRFWRDRMTLARPETVNAFALRFETDLYYRGLCLADRENNAVLSELLNRGEDAFVEVIYRSGRPETAALVQHASIDLQRRALAIMEMHPEFGNGHNDAKAYAQLVDRVRLYENEPQLYGTQFTCVGMRAMLAGRYDFDEIAENRAQLGLSPLDLVAQHSACQTRLGSAGR